MLLWVILVHIVGMWYVCFKETDQIKIVFKGHSDYLHCVVARNSRNQVYKLIQISKNTQRYSKAVSILAVKHLKPFFMV
ncbi:hypothetical protein GIB67_015680, partial [Kingdonia uniflora]